MYPATGKADLEAALADPRVRKLGWSSVSRNVVFLGLTSLVTDVSSEMITSIFPLYLMFRLQLSPVTFGLIDGLQQGGAALVALASGIFTDRWRRHREIAGAGYLMSALCRLGLLLVGRSSAGLIAVTSVDRLGKGLRTSPRDALISLSSPREGLAAAFGVHRALDTTGAMLGPIVAFALLRWIPGGYDAVFVVSFAVALIGVGILAAFVHNPPREAIVVSTTVGPIRNAGTLFGDIRFRIIAISGAALGLVTLSDSFVYLALQRRLHFGEAYLPLLFMATPAVYMLLATPAGWLADRAGRAPVIVAGYASLLGAYSVLLLPSQGMPALALCIILLGAYYAATDGVMMALASAVLPAGLRATGLSIVSTANNGGKILASLGFGWLWSRLPVESAVSVFAAALLVTLALVAGALFRLRHVVDRA